MVEELPEGYYLKNFLYLLTFVQERYPDVLSEQEQGFCQLFHDLSEDAQKALVRLLGRSQPQVRTDKFHYREINDVHQALLDLESLGLVRRNAQMDVLDWLHHGTKPELAKAFPDIPKSLKKADFCLEIAERHALDQVRAKLDFELIETSCKEVVQTLRLLFFGNLHQDFTDFVLHELGLVPYEQYALDAAGRYFQKRQTLEAMLDAYRLQDQAMLILEDENLSLAEFAEASLLDCQVSEPVLARRYGKILNRVARQLEREGAGELALKLYEQSSLTPARERRARILVSQSRISSALEVCRDIVHCPGTEAESEFAVNFAKRVVKKAGQQAPTWLPTVPPDEFQTETFELHHDPEFGVEEHVARYFREQGCVAEHIENGLLPGLFGLLFWDVIFAPVPGAFFHPFQRGPADLFTDQFVLQREAMIEDTISVVHDLAELQRRLLGQFESKYGLANPFVTWRYLSPEFIQLATQRIPAVHLEAVFRRMLKDLKNNRSGFPDLVVFPESGGYELVEVKGPGDTLQGNQKRWLRSFQAIQMPAKVVHVVWQD